jgi:hypothetical protein
LLYSSVDTVPEEDICEGVRALRAVLSRAQLGLVEERSGVCRDESGSARIIPQTTGRSGLFSGAEQEVPKSPEDLPGTKVWKAAL